MRRLLIITCLIFCYFIRLFLSPTFHANDQVSYRFIILDNPIQTGKVYMYYLGHTAVMWDQYPGLQLKDHVEIVGNLQSHTVLGITTKSTFKVVKTTKLSPIPLNIGETILSSLSSFRSILTTKLSQSLPEPESSLAAGILLGDKRDLSSEFKTSLIKSGTLHTVAASGYNVGLVSRYIISVTSFLPRQISLVLASIGILLFCLLSGSSAAVIRAGVMGVLILLGTGLGRQKDALRLLFVASYAMLIFDPLYLFDVGYQLSVAATFGILYLEPILSTKLCLPVRFQLLNNILKDYFFPTLAATTTTLPISYLTFGQISLIGLIANPFILPLIPLIMALTTIFLIVASVFPSLSSLFALILYLPLTYYKAVVNFFGSF